MMYFKEGEGPGLIMDQSPVEKTESRADIKSLLGERVTQCTDIYASLLHQDSEEVEYRGLSDKSVAELNDHVGQLGTLKAFLGEFIASPSGFKGASSKVEENLCSIKLYRKTDQPMGEGLEAAQTQLEFFTQGIPTEGEHETTYAVGLRERRSSDRTLELRDRQLENRRIGLKTVKAFINPLNGVDKVALYMAGIQLSVVKGEVRVQGVKNVGTRSHTYDLGNKVQFSMQEFDLLQRFIIHLATSLTRPR